MTEMRDSSTNPSFFSAGTGNDNFAALSATAVDGTTRTRLVIIVKLDTAASKLIQRMTSRDNLRIRGTAHMNPSSSYLSIVVDSAEAVET